MVEHSGSHSLRRVLEDDCCGIKQLFCPLPFYQAHRELAPEICTAGLSGFPCPAASCCRRGEGQGNLHMESAFADSRKLCSGQPMRRSARTVGGCDASLHLRPLPIRCSALQLARMAGAVHQPRHLFRRVAGETLIAEKIRRSVSADCRRSTIHTGIFGEVWHSGECSWDVPGGQCCLANTTITTLARERPIETLHLGRF